MRPNLLSPVLACILLLSYLYLTNGSQQSIAMDPAFAAAASVGATPQLLLAASKMTRRKPDRLVKLLSTDKSAFLTKQGAVGFGCHLHEHDEDEDNSAVLGFNPTNVLAEPSAADDAAKIELSAAFKLHSRASSPRKVYLEFHGCTTEGTDVWNKYYRHKTITTPEYDSDGEPGFSEGELQEIITCWAGVSQHFTLWDVDVTTENPGIEGIDRSDSATDQEYGIRVCVGGNSSWTGAVIGGIALLNSFGWVNKPGGETYRDAFVFSSNLISKEDHKVNINYVWKSISHEVGHTVGLLHKGLLLQGSTVQEYYKIPPQPGLWGPVMGVPGKALYAQWSNGSYPADVGPPSNTDDDLAIISQTLPLLVDERGSNPSNARVLCANTQCATVTTGSNPTQATSKVSAKITSGSDRDYYNVTVDDVEGLFKIQLRYDTNWKKESMGVNGGAFTQMWRVSPLRLELQFWQDGVEVMPGAADEWSTGQDFMVTLPAAGTYTFWVQPTQQLSSLDDAVHLPSNYGNVGDYTMTVTFAANNPPTFQHNAAPIAAADSFKTTQGTALEALDLLSNDQDPDGDNLTVVCHTAPQFGTLKELENGVYRYIPAADAVNVTDSFLYTVSDGQGASATALVTLSIEPPAPTEAAPEPNLGGPDEPNPSPVPSHPNPNPVPSHPNPSPVPSHPDRQQGASKHRRRHKKRRSRKKLVDKTVPCILDC